MTKLPKLDYRALGAELFIVFVGLFLALQVDEWRQDGELDEAEVRYLQRLKEDLESFVEYAEGFLETRESISSAVQHVSDSLTAGQIIGDDRRKFEAGIIYVGHLPDLRLQRSSYDEMVASGMFARLRSEELKSAIATLYATDEQTKRNFSWWRNSAEALFEELQHYVGPFSQNRPESVDDVRPDLSINRVEFKFETLHGERAIRNRYFWAADIHSDWVRMTRTLLTMTEEAILILDEELSNR